MLRQDIEKYVCVYDQHYYNRIVHVCVCVCALTHVHACMSNFLLQGCIEFVLAQVSVY